VTGGGEDDKDGLKPVPCSECGKSIQGVGRHENHVLQYGIIVCQECSENRKWVEVGGEDDDSVFEHVLTMDERGCRHSTCAAPVKHVFYTSKTGYVGVCRFHEDVYEEDIPSDDDRGVRGRQEIQEKYEELKENYSGHIGDSYKGKTLRWVLGEVDDL